MSKTSTLAALGLHAQGGREAQVTDITIDSRAVMPGTLFAALPGTRLHGGNFIANALSQGAVAILTDAEGAEIAADALAGSDVALVVSSTPRETLARCAALFFGAQPAVMAAVTGTNGKTSVSTFTRQIRR